jgi:hypothetical protein
MSSLLCYVSFLSLSLSLSLSCCYVSAAVLWNSNIEFMFMIFDETLTLSIWLMYVQSPNHCDGLVQKQNDAMYLNRVTTCVSTSSSIVSL